MLYARLLIAAALLLAVSSTAAWADCADPAAVEAEIVYSSAENVPMYCNGTDWIAMGQFNPAAGGSGCATATMGVKPEGHIFYNFDYHILQYCDGDDWRRVGVGLAVVSGCTGPADCAAIGDQCTDSTIFAGCHPTLDERLFLHPNNQSANATWNNGTTDYATTNCNDPEDGQANTSCLAGQSGNSDGPYAAAELCDDLNALGHTDWYLPSRIEMYYLWSVQGAINAGPGDAFVATSYWSSTENVSNIAWYQRFSDGDQENAVKNGSHDVRCLRRN